MPTKPLERLIFAQGGLCFFCRKPLSNADASVEHLVAIANGGPNNDENCVACCTSINRLLGRMSLKEKLQVVLNQKGNFRCPNGESKVPPVEELDKPHKTVAPAEAPAQDKYTLVIANLKQRGTSKPRTVKTLSSTINSLFQKKLSERELATILKRLIAEGKVKQDGTKISYALS